MILDLNEFRRYFADSFESSKKFISRLKVNSLSRIQKLNYFRQPKGRNVRLHCKKLFYRICDLKHLLSFLWLVIKLVFAIDLFLSFFKHFLLSFHSLNQIKRNTSFSDFSFWWTFMSFLRRKIRCLNLCSV